MAPLVAEDDAGAAGRPELAAEIGRFLAAFRRNPDLEERRPPPAAVDGAHDQRKAVGQD